jgi:uncharacterized protein YcsI (UPF0317 family)
MAVREGRWTTNTKRLALGFHQANVTILPKHLAFDFMRFCQRNSRALPILDVTDPGDPVPRTAAPDADIRIDIPSYCIATESWWTAFATCVTTGAPITWLF